MTQFTEADEMPGANQPITGMVGVEGGQLYYEVAGEGHPLVLIHAGISDSGMWDDQFGVFAQHHRVIRYDARGFGKSRTESVSFSNRQDLYDLLKHVGAEKAYVLGISRGGQIAIDFTLEHPEMVDALIPVAAGLGGYEHKPADDEKSKHEMQMFAEMDELWGKGEFARLAEMEVRMFVDGPGQSPDRVDPRVRERVQEMNANNFSRQDGETKPRPLEPPAIGRLAEIQAPTLIILGDLDTSGTLAMADFLARGIAGARKVVIPGTAHMVNMERPGEFNRVVLDFLSER